MSAFSVELGYTGADELIQVPNGVNLALVRMWAAAGGSNGAIGVSDCARGGPGGFVKFVLPVTPLEFLTAKVGQGGRKGGVTRAPGTGGGRTQLSRGSTVLAVAGAGAGAGGYGNNKAQSYGGKGGGLTAGDGQDGASNAGGASPGRGGSQLAGGAFGSPTSATMTPGTALRGGDGDLTSSVGQDGGWPNGGRASTFGERGGGGGDGWYGGGGGGGTGTWGNGGGGGSSYTHPSATDVVHLQGTNTSAPATEETGYVSGVAMPGDDGEHGGDGYIYIEWLISRQIQGVIKGETGQAASDRIVRIHDRATGSVLGSAVTDATGAYVVTVSFLGEVQRVVLDDDAGPLQNDIIDRVLLS